MEFSGLSGRSFIRMLGGYYRSDSPFARTARVVAESLATPFGGFNGVDLNISLKVWSFILFCFSFGKYHRWIRAMQYLQTIEANV